MKTKLKLCKPLALFVVFHKKDIQQQRRWRLKKMGLGALVIGYQTSIFPQEILADAWHWAPTTRIEPPQCKSISQSYNKGPSISPWSAKGWTAVQSVALSCRQCQNTGTLFGVKLWLGHMKTDFSHAPSIANAWMFAETLLCTSVMWQMCLSVK